MLQTTVSRRRNYGDLRFRVEYIMVSWDLMPC
jgi:hypothetical protein